MIKIAITQGHPGGIGNEVVLKAFSEPTMMELCKPVVYGSATLLDTQRQALQQEVRIARVQHPDQARENVLNVLETAAFDAPLNYGTDTPEAAAAEKASRQEALAACQRGEVEAVVHAPTNTPLVPQPSEMLMYCTDALRIGVALTDNANAEAQLTQEGIIQRIKQLNSVIKRDFLLTRPRIAVLSLHDDDQREETDILMPAIEELINEHYNVFGPLPATDFMEMGDYRSYDGILALQTTQAEKLIKQTGTDCAITYLAGQDILQTAPLQTAGLKVAGKGISQPQAFCQAIYAATDILRHRKQWDEAHLDPLQKLFHDKREERR